MITRSNIALLTIGLALTSLVNASCINVENTYTHSVVVSTTEVTTQKKGEFLNVKKVDNGVQPVVSQDVSSESPDSEVCLFDSKSKSLTLIYDFDKKELTQSHKEILQQYLTVVDQSALILVEGHADKAGPKKYNQNLSSQRANNVVSYLKNNLGQGKRIVSRAFGEMQPVCSVEQNNNEGCNRRVVLTLQEEIE